jgi:hypothetical protein
MNPNWIQNLLQPLYMLKDFVICFQQKEILACLVAEKNPMFEQIGEKKEK